MDIKTIPNFLPEPVFYQLAQTILSPTFTWYLTTSIVSPWAKQCMHSESKENSKLFFMSHMVYEKENYFNLEPIDQFIMGFLVSEHMYVQKLSTYYDVIGEPMPEGQFLKILKKEDLIRIKINFFPNTVELQEHAYHIDYDYPHKGAILSLNTCDGYTKIKETGTKYPSVENTLVIHDPSKHHCSTTTTNSLGRFNIVINYL